MSFVRAALLALTLGLAQGQTTTTTTNMTVTNSTDKSTSLVEVVTINGTEVETVTTVGKQGVSIKKVTGANSTEVTSPDGKSVTTTITLSNTAGVLTTKATTVVENKVTSVSVTTTSADNSTKITTNTTTSGGVISSSNTTVTAPKADATDKTSTRVVFAPTVTTTTNVDTKGVATTTNSLNADVIVTSPDILTTTTTRTTSTSPLTTKATTVVRDVTGAIVRTHPEVTTVTQGDDSTVVSFQKTTGTVTATETTTTSKPAGDLSKTVNVETTFSGTGAPATTTVLTVFDAVGVGRRTNSDGSSTVIQKGGSPLTRTTLKVDTTGLSSTSVTTKDVSETVTTANTADKSKMISITNTTSTFTTVDSRTRTLPNGDTRIVDGSGALIITTATLKKNTTSVTVGTTTNTTVVEVLIPSFVEPSNKVSSILTEVTENVTTGSETVSTKTRVKKATDATGLVFTLTEFPVDGFLDDEKITINYTDVRPLTDFDPSGETFTAGLVETENGVVTTIDNKIAGTTAERSFKAGYTVVTTSADGLTVSTLEVVGQDESSTTRLKRKETIVVTNGTTKDTTIITSTQDLGISDLRDVSRTVPDREYEQRDHGILTSSSTKVTGLTSVVTTTGRTSANVDGLTGETTRNCVQGNPIVTTKSVVTKVSEVETLSIAESKTDCIPNPVSNSPTTGTPTTGSPTTGSPTTGTPTGSPTTGSPTTGTPTGSPTTGTPTGSPTTGSPTTGTPTGSPTTGSPTGSPTTGTPTGTPNKAARRLLTTNSRRLLSTNVNDRRVLINTITITIDGGTSRDYTKTTTIDGGTEVSATNNVQLFGGVQTTVQNALVNLSSTNFVILYTDVTTRGGGADENNFFKIVGYTKEITSNFGRTVTTRTTIENSGTTDVLAVTTKITKVSKNKLDGTITKTDPVQIEVVEYPSADSVETEYTEKVTTSSVTKGTTKVTTTTTLSTTIGDPQERISVIRTEDISGAQFPEDFEDATITELDDAVIGSVLSTETTTSNNKGTQTVTPSSGDYTTTVITDTVSGRTTSTVFTERVGSTTTTTTTLVEPLKPEDVFNFANTTRTTIVISDTVSGVETARQTSVAMTASGVMSSKSEIFNENGAVLTAGVKVVTNVLTGVTTTTDVVPSKTQIITSADGNTVTTKVFQGDSVIDVLQTAATAFDTADTLTSIVTVKTRTSSSNPFVSAPSYTEETISSVAGPIVPKNQITGVADSSTGVILKRRTTFVEGSGDTTNTTVTTFDTPRNLNDPFQEYDKTGTSSAVKTVKMGTSITNLPAVLTRTTVDGASTRINLDKSVSVVSADGTVTTTNFVTAPISPPGTTSATATTTSNGVITGTATVLTFTNGTTQTTSSKVDGTVTTTTEVTRIPPPADPLSQASDASIKTITEDSKTSSSSTSSTVTTAAGVATTRNAANMITKVVETRADGKTVITTVPTTNAADIPSSAKTNVVTTTVDTTRTAESTTVVLESGAMDTTTTSFPSLDITITTRTAANGMDKSATATRKVTNSGGLVTTQETTVTTAAGIANTTSSLSGVITVVSADGKTKTTSSPRDTEFGVTGTTTTVQISTKDNTGAFVPESELTVVLHTNGSTVTTSVTGTVQTVVAVSGARANGTITSTKTLTSKSPASVTVFTTETSAAGVATTTSPSEPNKVTVTMTATNGNTVAVTTTASSMTSNSTTTDANTTTTRTVVAPNLADGISKTTVTVSESRVITTVTKLVTATSAPTETSSSPSKTTKAPVTKMPTTKFPTSLPTVAGPPTAPTLAPTKFPTAPPTAVVSTKTTATVTITLPTVNAASTAAACAKLDATLFVTANACTLVLKVTTKLGVVFVDINSEADRVNAIETIKQNYLPEKVKVESSATATAGRRLLAAEILTVTAASDADANLIRAKNVSITATVEALKSANIAATGATDEPQQQTEVVIGGLKQESNAAAVATSAATIDGASVPQDVQVTETVPPTVSPTVRTSAPTTRVPTVTPTTRMPTKQPTRGPTKGPTKMPTAATSSPTAAPTPQPTISWQSRFLFWIWITNFLSNMGGMIGF